VIDIIPHTTELCIIKNPKGNISKILNKSEDSFVDFGEAYLSEIIYQEIKPWKLHKCAILNLVVISGKVRFVVSCDDKNLNLKEYILDCRNNFYRLTIPSNTWFSFQGLGKKNIILSISNIVHDPEEVLREKLSFIDYDWSV